MKPNRCLAFVAALAALATFTGCQTTSPKPVSDIVVTLSSETPVGYAGSVTVDGQKQEVSGVTPTTLNYRGSRADCDIRKTSGVGTLKIDVQVGGRTITLTESGSRR